MDRSDDEQKDPAQPRKKKRRRAPRTTGEAARPASPRNPGAPSAAGGFVDGPTAAARGPLVAAAAAAVIAIALVGTGPSELGMWIAMAAALGLIASIHRLGRLGPP